VALVVIRMIVGLAPSTRVLRYVGQLAQQICRLLWRKGGCLQVSEHPDMASDGRLAGQAYSPFRPHVCTMPVAGASANRSRYRASLDAGGDPALIGSWIAETQAKKVTAQAEIRTVTGRSQMNRDEMAAIAAALGDLARVVGDFDPLDKVDIYAQPA
jgi:hypothetical protein